MKPFSHSALEMNLQAGIQYYQQGNLPAAEDKAREVLSIDPSQADALQLLGLVAFDAGYTQQGLELLSGAIKNNPTQTLYRINLAQRLLQLGQLESALEQIEVALELQPEHPIALNMAGILYQETFQAEKALKVLRLALKLDPASLTHKYNLALALVRQHHLKEGLDYVSQILQRDPSFIDALKLRGEIRQELNQLDKAQQDFEYVVSRAPEDVDARFYLGCLKILKNQLPEGWQEYEWRCKRPEGKQISYGLPQWQGETLAPNKRLLALSDAGFGDTLQFVRYLLEPDMPHGQITLTVPPALASLLKEQNWPFQIATVNETLQNEFSHEMPLLSFPALRQTTLQTIPHPTPYLKPAADGPKLPDTAKSYCQRIGFVWAGSPTNAIDVKRSCNLSWFIKLAKEHSDIFWVSLQKSPRSQEFEQFELPNNIWNADSVMQSFKDTSHLISQLDLVISVDTSVVHLAGAQGCPTWVLLPLVPDWRWGLSGETSPWYQHSRLFRQSERSNWKQVFRQVSKALSQAK